MLRFLDFYGEWWHRLIPIGIYLFLGIFVFSSFLYPGGSQADSNSIGFSWLHNYWCNLTSDVAVNGEPNPARPFAVSGLLILCLSLALFFIRFAQALPKGGILGQLIRWGGILSMLFACMIFTRHHDIMTILASVPGIFAVIGIIIAIYRSPFKLLRFSGLACLVLLLVNNLVYYSSLGIYFLPILQKITFLAVLIWVLVVNKYLKNMAHLSL